MTSLVGHRGFPARYPENTLSGIEAAIRAGAKAVEFDVQCSANGTAYVFHDDNLLRVTGCDALIYQCDDARLQGLSAHEPGRFGTQFLGEPLCTLQQVVELLLDYPEVTVFIEPKTHSLVHFGLAALMDTILATSHALGPRRQMISFHHPALAYARANGCAEIVWVLDDFSAASAAIARKLRPQTLCADIAILPAQLPQWLDCQWMIYPVNRADQLEAYLHMGVDYIETDDIAALLNQKLDWQRAARAGEPLPA